MELSAAAEHDASGSGKRLATGKRRRSLKRSLEYPCVSRLRHRRLLAYLRVHRKDKSFASVALETGFFFDVEHLVGLARLGRWLDAMNYISSFAPSTHVFGDEGQVLVDFVHMHNVLDGIATGRDHGTFYAELHENYLKKNHKAPPGDVKLGHIMLSLRDNPKLRASINWDLVRHKAAEIIKDLIAQVPEFNELLRIPNCPTRPHNILPIGFSSSRVKRHVKGVDRLQASDIARFYLQKKKRLPSSGHCLETISCGPSSQAIAKLADVLAVSVQAGICRLPRDQFPLSYSCQEGVLDAPVPRPICNRITSPAKSFGIASETNAGTKNPMSGGVVIHEDYLLRNKPKRPRTTEHQEIDARKRHSTGKLGQQSGSSSQAHCSLGDGTVGDVGSNMESWNAHRDGYSPPTEILSS